METVAAVDATFDTALLARAYRLVTGNHYQAPSGGLHSPGRASADSRRGRRLERIDYVGRGFDAIPGLTLVLVPTRFRCGCRHG